MKNTTPSSSRILPSASPLSWPKSYVEAEQFVRYYVQNPRERILAELVDPDFRRVYAALFDLVTNTQA